MSKKEKTVDIKKNIDLGLEEINTVENYISDILAADNFNRLNIYTNNEQSAAGIVPEDSVFQVIKEQNENIEFVSIYNNASPYKQLISEEEFYKIVEFNGKRLSNRAGRYQESLFGYYLDAKENQDMGYISDVLNKAIIFKNNLDYVKTLMQNKNFMKEWRRDFGSLSPVGIFKHDGNLRRINIVKERMI